MRTRAAFVAALVLPCSGCSWIFVTKAPETVLVPNYLVNCTDSRAAPVLDTLCSGLFVAEAIFILQMPECRNVTPGTDCLEDRGGAAAISAGVAILCGISAGMGYAQTGTCQDVKELNASCITGDVQACQRLRPGWVPPATPYPQPPSPAPPPAQQPAPQPPPAPPPPALPPDRPALAAPSIDPAAYQAAVAAAAR